MSRLSFSLRDVFWLTLVVGMGVGWGMERRRTANQLKDAHERVASYQKEFRALDQSRDMQADTIESMKRTIDRMRANASSEHAGKRPVGQN